VAGCSGPEPRTAAPPGRPDARAILAASTAGLAAGDYRFTASMPHARLTGTVDLPSHSYAETLAADEAVVDTVVVGDDRYQRPAAGRPWRYFDATGHPELTLGNPDRTGATALLAGVQTAELTGTTVTGKLDGGLTALTATTFAAVSARMDGILGYTATLDGDGRLVQLVVELPELLQTPAGTWILEISDYGSAPAAKAPVV
jgi:hypothetical protein